MPRRFAMSATLDSPTAAPSRKYAQLTELTVALRRLITPPPPSAFFVRIGLLGSGRRPLIFSVHGEVPSTESFTEKPFSSAVASTIALNVDPGWRPYGIGIVARLNCERSKPGPATIAFTSPFDGSIATSASVKRLSGSVL